MYLQMKYFKKPQINQPFCIIIRFIFKKPAKKLITGNSYWKRTYNYHFLEFSKIVATAVRSLLPLNLSEVG